MEGPGVGYYLGDGAGQEAPVIFRLCTSYAGSAVQQAKAKASISF
jgi:hypothetical protein